MAAVGGTDQFTVVVSDEAAGLHVHGPLGLLKFVPILGNFLNPGGGARGGADDHRQRRAGRQASTCRSPTISTGVWRMPGSRPRAVRAHRWIPTPTGTSGCTTRSTSCSGLTNGVPEDGPGTYVEYDSDAALAHDELGMNTFRMSIEWSRIFPNSTASVDISDEGGGVSLADLEALDALANQDEVEHYREVFDSLRAHGLEPLVTVNHFTLPAVGARPDHDAAAGAARVARTRGRMAVARHPGRIREVRRICRVEVRRPGRQLDRAQRAGAADPHRVPRRSPAVVPNWPPGLIRPDLASTFLVNEAKGYVAAYDAIHTWDTTVATRGPARGLRRVRQQHDPGTPGQPGQSAGRAGRRRVEQLLQPLVPERGDRRVGGRRTSTASRPPTRSIRRWRNKVDFIGVQYYGSQPMQGFGVAPIPGFPWLKGLPVRCDGLLADVQRLQPTDRSRWIARSARHRGVLQTG